MKEQKQYPEFSCINKNVVLILFVFLFIAIQIQVQADTIIDSIGPNSYLDGVIKYSQNSQSLEVRTTIYSYCAGDEGDSMIWPDPNSFERSYLSFVLPDIPYEYEVDSAYIRLYQSGSVGNMDIYGNFEPYPLFYGEEYPCILDHIDYGNTLDPSDWTKGDPDDPGTLQSNIGIISDSGVDDTFRYMDLTDFVQNDYIAGREKTQYRLRFEIGTDWDNLGDGISFESIDMTDFSPLLVLYFTPINSIDEVENNLFSSIGAYPNPFSNSIEITFSFKVNTTADISIYNLQGRFIKELASNKRFDKGKNSIKWSGYNKKGKKVKNGVYFCKFNINDNYTEVLRIIYIK